jgi:hypothetical protein
VTAIAIASTGFTTAHGFAPARGLPPAQVIPATLVAVVVTVLVGWGAIRYRQDRFPALARLASRTEETTGMPGWAALPALLAGASLIVAVFGFYWDVSWHIDKGRDEGPFSTPAHYPIIIGLAGIAIAGLLAVTLDRDRHPSGVRLPRLGRVSVGAALLLLCGVVALAGFPLDDLWHTLFGQDVTLWGPTHIQMIGGASLATLAVWILVEEGRRRGGEPQAGHSIAAWVVRHHNIIVGGAFLIGLSTLQGEFDFGVPQFRAVYHPILIMLAAGIGLVAVRIRAGRGGALGAALFFIALRGLLTLIIGPGLGRSTLHFPLYLTEAALVEVAALVVPRGRQVLLGAVSGLLIGTVGLAAEWGWSQVWMPLPWRGAMWPTGAILGFVVAVAAGVLGGMTGRALLPPGQARGRTPRLVAPAAWAAAFVVIAFALPMGTQTGTRATVDLKDAASGPHRTVTATIRLDPPQAADKAVWFNVTSWQGGNGVFGSKVRGQVITPLQEVSPGVYRTTQPVPVYGKWKSLLRLSTVGSLSALPIYLPADAAIPAKGVPASPHFTREFVRDKTLLQREAVGGSPTLERIAYALLLVIALVWIAGMALGLRRLDRVAAGEREGGGMTGVRRPGGARSGRPAVAQRSG